MGALRQAQLALTAQEAPGVSPAPSTGTLTNLVVFIRFSGESGFTNTLSTYAGMFTDSTPEANSLRNYFLDVSYDMLTVNSNFYPTPAGATILSYQDSHPRTYFEPYDAATNPGGYQDSQRTEREQTLLRDAIEYIKTLGQFPVGAVIDADNDGEVDSMTFVIKGSGNGWAELLWPHQWSLYYYTVTINGKTVGNYAFQLDDWMGNSVLAHEMFHVLGAPDLYHYNFDGMRPVGTWDVMESNTNPPQHMGCYMKYKYGDWIDSIPLITQPGTYTLNPLASEDNNCYKIASPNSTSEFFILEYRSKASSYFETGIPGSGLLVYRINPAVQGNADGPPDEVYVFRPGGTPTQDGTYPTANFSSTVGRTQINAATDPYTFLSGGGYGGLSLCNIGATDTTISFNYGNCGALQVLPAAHDFGSVNLGSTSSAQAFSLTNNGSESVNVGTLSVSSSYNLLGNTCNGISLAPAAACAFSVTFSPLSAGLLPGLVTIPSNDPSSPNLVGLSGTGTGVYASVNPTSWNFGDQAVSYSSGAKNFTLTSSGNANLVLGTLTVSGDFSLVNNTCNGQTLVPAATCSFGVIFTPTVTGARSGSVSIPSNAFGAPATVPLSGNGTTPGYCTSSGDPGYEFISRVQLGSGDQSSAGDAYHDYTATNFTSLARGTSNPMQVTGSTTGSYQEYVKAWVDFNHDFDFNDPGEELNFGSYNFSGTHIFNASLSVPADASLGATRMRVILRYSSAPTPCNPYLYGETEDYTVTIAETLDPGVQVDPASVGFRGPAGRHDERGEKLHADQHWGRQPGHRDAHRQR